MRANVVQFSFNSGELSPRMHGRVDVDQYSAGAAEMVNFLPLPQGGAMSRSGTKHLDGELTMATDALTVSFTPSSDQSFILVFEHTKISVFSSDGAFIKTFNGTPYTAAQLQNIRWDQQVDKLFIANPNHEPYVIKYVGGATQFEFGKLTEEPNFKCAPLGKINQTDTQLTVSNRIHRLKVTASSGVFVAGCEEKYIEFPVGGGNYSLFRIKARISDLEALVEPITSVVKDIDKSARLFLLKSNYIERSFPQTTVNDHELRSDTAIFGHDLENAYARIDISTGLVDDGFYKVHELWQKDTAGTDSLYPEGVVWVKFNRYEGQRDYSSELRQGIIHEGFIKVGNIYRILENPTTQPVVNGVVQRFGWRNAAPVDEGTTGLPNLNKGFAYFNKLDTFAATAGFGYYTREDTGAGVWWMGKEHETCVANLSKSKSYDIMRTSAPLVMLEDASEVTYTFLDEDPQSSHTASVKSSKTDTFSSSDVGRYIYAKHGTRWVLYKIKTYTTGSEVQVDVLSAVPTEPLTDRIVDSGQTSIYTMSLWRTNSGPSAVSIFEQRLVFSGTINEPETVCFSKTTDQYDFRTFEDDGSVLDTTGISYSIGGSKYNKITWLSSTRVLLIGTRDSECQLRSVNFGEPLTPRNVRITHETFNGSNYASVFAGSSVIYVSRSGTKIYEMLFDYEINAFRSVDLTILAEHIFEADPIKQVVFQNSPRPTLWVVTESGKIASLLYEKSQNIYAWSRHDFGRTALSVCVVTGSNHLADELVISFIEDREAFKYRSLESLSPDFSDSEENNFKENMRTLDSYQLFTGVSNANAITTIQARLNGYTVSLICDGAYIGDYEVSGEQLVDAPDIPYTKYALIGFAYTCRIKTLPLAHQTESGNMFGQTGRIQGLIAQLYRSVGMSYGSDEDGMELVNFHPTITTMNQSPKLFTGFKSDFVLDSSHDNAKQIVISQTQPYPLTLLSLTLKV